MGVAVDAACSELDTEIARDVSVIIPAYGRCPHLASIVRALLSGETRPAEIIISHSGAHDPSTDPRLQHPAVRVLHSPDRLYAGAARNRGAGVANSGWCAFLDADVLPAPDWLAQLTSAVKQGDARFVVGAVGFAEPGGYWGVTNWLCEFSEMAPWRARGRQTGGASCNMIVARDDLAAVGGFANDARASEDTLLFHSLRTAGLEHWFEPTAEVGHFNIPGLAHFARHQRRMGYFSAMARRRARLKGTLATKVRPLAILIWGPRLILICKRVMSGPLSWKLALIGLMPGILLGMTFWTFGFTRAVYSDMSTDGGLTGESAMQ